MRFRQLRHRRAQGTLKRDRRDPDGRREDSRGEKERRADEEAKQRLRLNRFLLASTFSMLYVVVLGIYYSQDQIDAVTLVAAASIVIGAIVAFFALFRSRLNLRFADPSLTALQVTAAVGTMLLVVYRAPETRAVFTAFFFVALVFGMLRSSARQLAVLGSASLAGFAAVTLSRYVADRDMAVLRLDMLQLGVTAITFPWLVFLGGRVKELKEADRRKDNFLATLAHELRNPLAPIRTGVQILRKTETGPHAQTILPMMERQVQHLTRLLDDLLDINRIRHGKISLHIERTDLRECVQAAVEASRSLIEQMRHDFTLSVPARPVWLDADSVRVTQIISNLLNNAARYTPAGGRIELTVTQQAEVAEISIRDNGMGIPAERLDTIFEMFSQIEGSTQPPQAGLGIGLSLVKGLVGLLEGSIQVHSDGSGRGSEFRIRLPVAAAPAQALPPRSRADERPSRLKVLVVDDSVDAASTLSTLVQLMGHDAYAVHDGEAAVGCAEETRPDVVLLDLGLPGIDGLEACRQIRRHPWGSAMRIVAVTGWGQDDDRRRSAAAGFDEHVVKPIEAATLEQVLSGARSATPA